MNKPYTYTNLIKGNRVVARYHKTEISKLEKDHRLSPENREKLEYHRSQLEYFNEEYDRFLVAKKVCNDSTVLVR